MFGLSNVGRQSRPNGGTGTYEPLLDDTERQNNVVFSVEDDEDDIDEHNKPGEEEAHEARTRTVRFEEDVRVLGPPLRSTIVSRETGVFYPRVHATVLIYVFYFEEFELDDDTLDDSALTQLQANSMNGTGNSRRNGEQTMPLLVGLADASIARRSLDIPLSATGINTENGYLDLEDIAAKRTAGGNLFDSVANMANSILGAGELEPVCRLQPYIKLNILPGIIGSLGMQ